mgnify:CR=1 FL=1
MNRRDFLTLFGASTLAACAATGSSLAPASNHAPSSGKKGLGLAGGWGERQLRSLGVAWYYAWSSAAKISTSVPFVPMAFSPKHIAELGQVPVALGFIAATSLLPPAAWAWYAVMSLVVWSTVVVAGVIEAKATPKAGAPASATHFTTPTTPASGRARGRAPA